MRARSCDLPHRLRAGVYSSFGLDHAPASFAAEHGLADSHIRSADVVTIAAESAEA